MFGVVVVTGEPRRILTASDRCDQRACTAAAYHRLQFEKGTLDFCGHHFDEKPVESWESIAWHIDESWAI